MSWIQPTEPLDLACRVQPLVGKYISPFFTLHWTESEGTWESTNRFQSDFLFVLSSLHGRTSKKYLRTQLQVSISFPNQTSNTKNKTISWGSTKILSLYKKIQNSTRIPRAFPQLKNAELLVLIWAVLKKRKKKNIWICLRISTFVSEHNETATVHILFKNQWLRAKFSFTSCSQKDVFHYTNGVFGTDAQFAVLAVQVHVHISEFQS